MKGRGDLIELVPWGGRALEVGVNEGDNLLEWVTRRPDVICHGADSWEGKFKAAMPRAYSRIGSMVFLHPHSSLEVAEQFRNSRDRFDLIYIDAHHEYANVAADIRAWWPMVKVGGILAGHDYEMKPPMDGWEAIEVKKAVDDWAAENNLKINVIDEPAPSWWVRKVKA
jgi:hypothetical protein